MEQHDFNKAVLSRKNEKIDAIKNGISKGTAKNTLIKKWWLVYGIERSGTSFMVRVISREAKAFVSDPPIRIELRKAARLSTGTPDKKILTNKIVECIAEQIYAGEGVYLDLAFKLAGLTFDEYRVLVELFGEPERKIYCLREPEGYIESAAEHFGHDNLSSLKDHYVEYLDSGVFEKIGGEAFEYLPALSIEDYKVFLGLFPWSGKCLGFVYSYRERKSKNVTPEMYAAYSNFKKRNISLLYLKSR